MKSHKMADGLNYQNRDQTSAFTVKMKRLLICYVI